MAISLSSIRKVAANKPPRIVIFGPAGVGKTTLASEAPAPIFIQAEDGTPGGMELDSFGEIRSYADVTGALGVLANDSHHFKTVVIDTFDALEPMLHEAVCKENGWPDIEAPGFGRGYTAAVSKWEELLRGLDHLRVNNGMNVIMLGHSEVGTVNPPGMESYSRYGLRVRSRAAGVIADTMDIVCFINFKSELKKIESGFGKTKNHAEGGGTRWVYLEERPAFLAKNRYGLPPESMVVKGKTIQNWAKVVPFATPDTDLEPPSDSGGDNAHPMPSA